MCAQLWSFMQTPRLYTQTATCVKGTPPTAKMDRPVLTCLEISSHQVL